MRAPGVWRCKICDCSLDTANRRRARQDLPPLHSLTQHTCTPDCSKALFRRVRWRCAVCGCKDADAAAKRKRLGLGRRHKDADACTPSCADTLARARTAARLRRLRRFQPPDPHGGGGEWRCPECGVDEAGAVRKRRRVGLGIPVRPMPVCTPACAAARKVRRHRARLAAVPRASCGRKRSW